MGVGFIWSALKVVSPNRFAAERLDERPVRGAVLGGHPRRQEIRPRPNHCLGMYVSIVCTALLGLLLFGIALFVSIQRQRYGTLIGYDQNPVDAIHRAVQAHANTTGYAPFPAIMLYSGGTAPITLPRGSCGPS
jgi:hypothetical protein